MFREIFSTDTLTSVYEDFNLRTQSKRARKALSELPTLAQYFKQTILNAPYLFILYLIVASIDLQYRIVGQPSQDIAIANTFIIIGLLTVANALCYIEVRNAHTLVEKIQKPGWYAVNRLLRLIAVLIASTVIIIIGSLLFIVPGIYFSLRLSLAGPACIIDDLKVKESLVKSIEVTRKQTMMIYAAFSALALLLIPTVLLVIIADGVLEIAMVFILYGVCPVAIQITLGILYLNGTDDNTIEFYIDQEKQTN